MLFLGTFYLLVILLLNVSVSKSQENDLFYEETSDCRCGISAVLDSYEYIINGDEVEDMRTYPWLVTLHDLRVTRKDGWGYCAGALISQDTILTAAHCVYIIDGCEQSIPACVIPPDQIQIGLLGPSKREPARKVGVKRIMPHERYNLDGETPNDIALIKLAEPVPCTEYTRPICLTSEDIAKETSTLYIAGFGFWFPFLPSNVLREGTTWVVDGEICKPLGLEPTTTICAVGKPQQICYGDSGSPALMKVSDQYFAVGVSAGGVRFCPLGSPAFYTRISSYYSFIQDGLRSP